MFLDPSQEDSIQFNSLMNLKMKSSYQQHNESRIISDPIYKSISFRQPIWNIIDTPIYQRLRNIKQLGATNYVFQGATHTRFEHCLGVGHLAQKFMKQIQKNQMELFNDISSDQRERIRELVTIAGVIHDLGHGPFSHMFDNLLIPKLTGNKEWNHEKGSEDLFRYLCDQYQHKIDLEQHEINYIIDLIHGDNQQTLSNQSNKWIFDIVSNQRNSIDVDKIDYLVRDSYSLGMNSTLSDFSILMKGARVIDDEICYPAKYVMNIYDIFSTRYKLYKTVYLNRISQAIEQMLLDIFLETNEVFKFEQMINDPRKYYKIHDGILNQVEQLEEDKYSKAQMILKRLHERDLYKYVGEVLLNYNIQLKSQEQIRRDIYSCIPNNDPLPVLEEEIYVITGSIGYGLKNINPVSKVSFFKKSNPTSKFKLEKHDASFCLPTNYGEKFIRVFTSSGLKLKKVKEGFEKYCKNTLQQSPGKVEGYYEKTSPLKFRNSLPLENSFTPKKLIKRNDQ